MSMQSVLLAPYSEEWPARFAEAEVQLRSAFAPQVVFIEHIGSTSIPGLAAKPITDVLLGAASLDVIEDRIDALAELGCVARDETERAFARSRAYRHARSVR